MSRLISAAFVLICTAVAVGAGAEAQEIQFDFTATVTAISDPDGLADWTIGSSDPAVPATTISGKLILDGSVEPHLLDSSLYRFDPSTTAVPVGITGSIGSNAFDFDEEFILRVVNNSSAWNWDEFIIDADATDDQGNRWVFHLYLMDSDGQVFSDTSLPRVTFNLSDFETNFGYISFEESGSWASADFELKSLVRRGRDIEIYILGAAIVLIGIIVAFVVYQRSPMRRTA